MFENMVFTDKTPFTEWLCDFSHAIGTRVSGLAEALSGN